MNRFRSRCTVFLRVIIGLGIIFQLTFCQHAALNYRPEKLEGSTIIKKMNSKGICNFKELDEASYFCEPLENSTNAAYLRIDCELISKKDSQFLILGDCKDSTDLSGNLVSLNSCSKFVCDIKTGPLSLLIVRVSGRAEHSRAIEHFKRDFRFRESTRSMKLSPTPVHFLYKKYQLFADSFNKSTPWISPFYGKYVVYYIGSDDHIPTLDWSLQRFEDTIFMKFLNLKDKNEIEINEDGIVSIFATVYGISWLLSTIMEIYWTRGIDRQFQSQVKPYDPETSSFDTGLSYRTYCSLDFSSFIFNMKYYTDFTLHNYNRYDSVSEVDVQAENIRDIFILSRFDLDSFYLTYSPNELNANSFNLSNDEFFNKPFPCMSKYKNVQKLRKTAFDDYSNNNVRKSPDSEFTKLRKIVNEDILVLVNIIYEFISNFVIVFYKKNLVLIESSERIMKYYKIHQKLFSKISELKSEVDKVCGRKAFKIYTKNLEGKKMSSSSSSNTGSSSNDKSGGGKSSRKSTESKNSRLEDEPVCSLRYSMEVVRRLESIFFSAFEDYRYNEQLRKIQLNSPEYLLKSTYCFSRALFENNYKDVPNETIIKTVLTNSIIYKLQTSTSESIKSECLEELRDGDLSWLVDLESNSQVCESYSTCMFGKDSMNKSVEIFNKLSEIDQEGGFHEKSALIKEMCIYSDKILGLNLATNKGGKSNGSDSNLTNCQGFRLLQLSLRTCQLQQEAALFKFRNTLVDKFGNSYLISDTSTVSYLLINDFCMDPEITSLIQCNFDWQAFHNLEDLRKSSGKGEKFRRTTNSIILQDGYTIYTPLYFRDTTDRDFITLSNGVLFARIASYESSPSLRLTYFNGLPYPYHMNNDNLKRKICEKFPSKFTYNPEVSNPQRILVLKLSYDSTPISLIVDEEYFDNKTLIRNSLIYKDKFSVVDAPGLSIPLTPSIIQIESTLRSKSPCNSILFPYLMIQEFVNPIGFERSDSSGVNKSSNKNSKNFSPTNTMDDISYPTNLLGVLNNILNVEPLALNFIVTGRGRRFLKMFLKSNYYLGYHFLTTLVTFWTGGSRFRQHCDMHPGNILTRFPSSWKSYKWEKYLTNVLNHVDQRYFSVIDVDYSYESEMKITNLEEDIKRLPDKNPCSHPSVIENNHQVSRNDYERIMEFFCDSHMSFQDLSMVILESYPTETLFYDLSSKYHDIMTIHNYTMDYCEEAKSMIEGLKERGEDDLATGFKMIQDLRRTIWNSILGLERLERLEMIQNQGEEPVGKSNLFGRFLFSGSGSNLESLEWSSESLESNNKNELGTKNLRRTDSLVESKSSYSSIGDDSKQSVSIEGGHSLPFLPNRIVPGMLSSIPEQSLSFYCAAVSTRKLLDVPSLKFTDLLNFLLQRSSLEGYIRQIHLGSSFEEFELTRGKLESVEQLKLECMQDPENKNIVVKMAPIIYSNADIICPKDLCSSVKHYDIFESMISVYRFHLSHLVSAAYHLGDSYSDLKDQMLSIKAWMVERKDDGDPSSSRSEKKMLKLRLDQINSIIELYHFCIRDRFYSSLSYGQLKCKTIPEFDKYGKDSNGLLILEFSSVSDNSSSFIVFPWMYNSNFSIFESEFSFKEVNGISVIGIVKPFGRKVEGENDDDDDLEERKVFIHKGGKCIYDYNSRIDEYKAPPSVINKVSDSQEHLYRNSFIGYEKMEMNNLSVFTLEDGKRISFYSWVKGVLNGNSGIGRGKKDSDLNGSSFSSIKRNHQNELIILVGFIVRTFKSIWIPNPECKHYSRFKTVCFPMFCGISSKNIILKVGENRRIKGVKFLFGQDIKILNAYNEITGFNSEGPGIQLDESDSSSEIEDLANISHILPNNCSDNYDEVNDMITLASTLEYLTTVIATDGILEPSKLFSSNVGDVYYRYFKMTLEEIIGQVNRFCEILQAYSGSKNRVC
ncbi:large containing a signal peptide [Cryptosporidium sp. chipmunk genotype I]|uniref:large containing a signal peptide n=1 Tax=Cryptosporidium sp. chipmunk genotype I TaxID=1280935 RepID=UPI003519E0C8|nr:large containing a signal peptide [Cryptosporidium sp. chipmunk genotype I]